MTGPTDAVTAEEAVGDVLDTPEAGRRVVTGGAIRIAGYAIGLLASVASAAVMLRYLGEDYGRFGTVTALVTSIQLVTDLGMTVLGVREYAQREGEERDRFMRVLLGMRVVTTVLLVGVALLLALLLGYDDEMLLGTVLLGIATALASITSTVAIPLQANIQMGLLTAIDLARQVGTAAGYILLSVGGASLVAFLGLPVPIYLVVLAVTFAYVRGAMPLRPAFDPAEWVRLLRPTMVFALATAIGAIYIYAAMVLTELVATPKETTDFAAAFRVFMIIAAFPALLASTAFPVLSRAARDDRGRLQYASQRLFEGSALLGALALVGLVLGAPIAMDILGGEEFRSAVPVLRIQGAALALTFVIAAFGYTLLAMHRHRAIILANLASLAVSASTVLTLGSAHGAQGASVGVLLGEITLAVGYFLALGARPNGARPELAVAARIALATALGAACWFLPAPPLVQVTLGVAVFGAAALLLRAVPDEVLTPIRDRLGGAR